MRCTTRQTVGPAVKLSVHYMQRAISLQEGLTNGEPLTRSQGCKSILTWASKEYMELVMKKVLLMLTKSLTTISPRYLFTRGRVSSSRRYKTNLYINNSQTTRNTNIPQTKHKSPKDPKVYSYSSSKSIISTFKPVGTCTPLRSSTSTSSDASTLL